MTAFVGLLRAINVGGTGKLAMKELVALCEQLGFESVKTYIQSGNVVFETKLSEPKAQAKLQKALTAKLGKAVGVTLRSADELAATVKGNPFKKAAGNRVIVLFMEHALPKKALAEVVAPDGEELVLSGREIYIHYPNGQGRSKLKLPFFKEGTGRNLNTVAKLADLAQALES